MMCNPLCDCGSELQAIDIDIDGTIITMACIHCDMPPEPQGYQNHCWNCAADIDSRYCKVSPTPNMGYICNCCGKDLLNWKLKRMC